MVNVGKLVGKYIPGTPNNQFKMDFLSKDFVHHPIDSQPFLNGWPSGSRYVSLYLCMREALIFCSSSLAGIDFRITEIFRWFWPFGCLLEKLLFKKNTWQQECRRLAVVGSFFCDFVQYSLQISSPPQCQMILNKGSLALTWRELIENATGKNQLHRKVRSQQVRWKTTIEISSKRSWRDWRNFQVFCRC